MRRRVVQALSQAGPQASEELEEPSEEVADEWKVDRTAEALAASEEWVDAVDTVEQRIRRNVIK